jgi:uncharacterized protein YybS (DUF2232 family)
MPTRRRQLAEFIVVTAIALGLLLVSVTTLIGVITFFFLPIPFIYFAVRNDGRNCVILLLLFALGGTLLVGPFAGLIGFLLGMVGVVMGVFYQRWKRALPTVAAGAGAVFLAIVVGLALLTYGLDFNLLTQLEKTKQEILNGAISFPVPPVMTEEEWKKSVEWEVSLFQMILPTFFFVSSFVFSGMVHWLARITLKLFKEALPALPPIREWNFPRSLLFYYFVSLLLLLFAESMPGSFWPSAILNVKVMLDIIFTIQGLSFCLLAFYLKKWKILTPALVVSLFIFPFLTYILSLLGIFDLGLNLRKRLETRVKRG